MKNKAKMLFLTFIPNAGQHKNDGLASTLEKLLKRISDTKSFNKLVKTPTLKFLKIIITVFISFCIKDKHLGINSKALIFT